MLRWLRRAVTEEKGVQMCDGAREKVVSKVRSLFERTVGNGCSESEAIAAALAAQRLVAKYGITDEELSDGRDRGEIAEEKSAQVTTAWSADLALAVAEAFRCRVYALARRGTPKKSFTFVGYATDASSARLAFDYLHRASMRLASEETAHLRREFPHASMRGVKASYCAGFCAGVRDELERQTQALMVVVPAAVNDAYDGIVGGSRSYRPRSRAVYDDVFSTGRSAGRDAARSRGIEGSLGLCE